MDARRTNGVNPVVVSPVDELEMPGSEKRTRFFDRFLDGVVGR